MLFNVSATYLIITAISYVLLVRSLRYRRLRRMLARHASTRLNYDNMTVDEAHHILETLAGLEFPKIMSASIGFALLKTYGIPSISKLLVQTGELASSEAASKRMADTRVLIVEFCFNKPSSRRAIEAIARMNYLHSGYLKAGKITNDDMLYTLSVFALEPARWINGVEWRTLTDLELCACGTFWKAMGDKMNIDMDPLRDAQNGVAFPNGLVWYRALQRWSLDYEKQHMVFAESNRRLANAHLEIILSSMPWFLKTTFRNVFTTVAGAQLADALGLEAPPKLLAQGLHGLMIARRHAIRHLALPRFRRKKHAAKASTSTGHYHVTRYLGHPWYVKPTFTARWAPGAWVKWLLGRKLPGDDGLRYHPEGYVPLEVGPERKRTEGREQMDEDIQRLTALTSRGCPFSLQT